MKRLMYTALWLVVVLMFSITSASAQGEQRFDYRFVFFVEHTQRASSDDPSNQRWIAAEAAVIDIVNFYRRFLREAAPGRYNVEIAVVPFDGGEAALQPIQFKFVSTGSSPWIKVSDSAYDNEPLLKEDFDFWKNSLQSAMNAGTRTDWAHYPNTVSTLKTLLTTGQVGLRGTPQVTVIYLASGVSCPTIIQSDCGSNNAIYEPGGLREFGNNLNTTNWGENSVMPGTNLHIYHLPFAKGFSDAQWGAGYANVQNITTYRAVDGNKYNNQQPRPELLLPTIRGILNRIWNDGIADPDPLPFEVYKRDNTSGKALRRDNFDSRIDTAGLYQTPIAVTHLIVAGYGLKPDTNFDGTWSDKLVLDSNPADSDSMQVFTFQNTTRSLEISGSASPPENLTRDHNIFVYTRPLKCIIQVSVGGQPLINNTAYQYEVLTLETDCGSYPLRPEMSFRADVFADGQVISSDRLTYQLDTQTLRMVMRLQKAGKYTIAFTAYVDQIEGLNTPQVVFQADPITELTVLEVEKIGPRVNNADCSAPAPAWPGEKMTFTFALNAEVPSGGRNPDFSQVKWFRNEGEEFTPVQTGGYVEFTLEPLLGPEYIPNSTEQSHYFSLQIAGQEIDRPLCVLNIASFAVNPSAATILYSLSNPEATVDTLTIIDTNPSQSAITFLNEQILIVEYQFSLSQGGQASNPSTQEITKTNTIFIRDLLNNTRSAIQFPLDTQIWMRYRINNKSTQNEVQGWRELPISIVP